MISKKLVAIVNEHSDLIESILKLQSTQTKLACILDEKLKKIENQINEIKRHRTIQ